MKITGGSPGLCITHGIMFKRSRRAFKASLHVALQVLDVPVTSALTAPKHVLASALPCDSPVFSLFCWSFALCLLLTGVCTIAGEKKKLVLPTGLLWSATAHRLQGNHGLRAHIDNPESGRGWQWGRRNSLYTIFRSKVAQNLCWEGRQCSPFVYNTLLEFYVQLSPQLSVVSGFSPFQWMANWGLGSAWTLNQAPLPKNRRQPTGVIQRKRGYKDSTSWLAQTESDKLGGCWLAPAWSGAVGAVVNVNSSVTGSNPGERGWRGKLFLSIHVCSQPGPDKLRQASPLAGGLGNTRLGVVSSEILSLSWELKHSPAELSQGCQLPHGAASFLFSVLAV